MNAALMVSDLVAGYAGSSVLHGISLCVEAGEVVAVLGRNGVGKTTCADTIAGSLPATAGAVALHGVDVTAASAAARFAAGLRSMRQTRPVFADLSVADNLAMVGADTRSASQLFGFLAGRDRQTAGTLSGGEQKMLALARTCLSGGSVWVLDEPTEGLQPANVARSGDLVADAARRGIAVVLIEQNLEIALAVADRWIVVERGRVIDAGHVGHASRTQIVRHLGVERHTTDAEHPAT